MLLLIFRIKTKFIYITYVYAMIPCGLFDYKIELELFLASHLSQSVQDVLQVTK